MSDIHQHLLETHKVSYSILTKTTFFKEQIERNHLNKCLPFFFFSYIPLPALTMAAISPAPLVAMLQEAARSSFLLAIQTAQTYCFVTCMYISAQVNGSS